MATWLPDGRSGLLRFIERTALILLLGLASFLGAAWWGERRLRELERELNAAWTQSLTAHVGATDAALLFSVPEQVERGGAYAQGYTDAMRRAARQASADPAAREREAKKGKKAAP